MLNIDGNKTRDSSMKDYLPLLRDFSETATIAFYNGRHIKQKIFLSHVGQVCELLKKHKYSINLCEDRYHFLVVFSACTLLKQISLLPNSRAPKEIERLQGLYEDNHLVNDRLVEKICQKDESLTDGLDVDLKVESDHVVAIVFTSGSTGIPKANHKTWRQLFESAIRVKERFLNEGKQYSVIATVPPQHMFGFETTIIYPLILGVAIHAGRPFYPLDIKKALAEMPSPTILITTPIHLRACNNEEKEWPNVNFIISATSEMEGDVAIEAEKTLNTRVFEIYGCSEAGAIATRQMTKDEGWHLLTDYKIASTNKVTVLNAPGYQEDIVIPDQLEIYNVDCFRLVGRNSDLINIGGKRGSLLDLANRLKTIDGVSDAVFVLPDDVKGRRVRMAALVVSDLDTKHLRKELSKHIDSVFIPRPLIVVKQLPYNEYGKLPRQRLIEVLNQESEKVICQEAT